MQRSKPLARGKPLKRKTPMKRGAPPKRYKRLRRRSRRQGGAWMHTTRRVKDRDGHRCRASIARVCDPLGHGFDGLDVHHLWRRSQGGPDEDWNLLTVCRPCHATIHANPSWSIEVGLLRRRPNGNDPVRQVA